MAHRILAFEADPSFAKELAAGFAGRDVALEVVADGQTGLDRAAAEPPDLILLSIELPSMNGFLVCKKIKKSGALKQIPLIILSSDANAGEIFEQHKKLRTRAEDYVQKPVPMDQLVETIRQFVPIADAAAAESAPVDDEIDAFADEAFDALLVEDPVEPEELSVDEVEIPDAFEEEDPTTILSAEMLEEAGLSEPEPTEVAPVVDDGGGEATRESAAAAAALEQARARIAELESQLASTKKDADKVPGLTARAEEFEGKVTKLEREIAALKAEGGGGISSREFLDLREKLNSKDKEILDLRDQMSARDKELLELRDRSIQVEREKADVEDKVLALERRVATAEEQNTALTADKEGLNKRLEETKERLAKAQAKASGLEEELEAERSQAAAKIQQMEESHADAMATSRAQAAAALEGLKEEHAAALEAAKAEHESALQALASENQAALESAQASHAAALAQLAEERDVQEAASLAAQKEALEAEKKQALEAAEADKNAALEQKAQELAAREAELEEEKNAAIAQKEQDHGKELALLGRKLADTENRVNETTEALQALEEAKATVDAELARRTEDLGQRDQELADAKGRIQELESSVAQLEQAKGALEARVSEIEEHSARLEAAKADLEGRLTAAMQKIATDDALLERARKAMAIGLGLLEDQKRNAIEGANGEAQPEGRVE